MRDASTSFAPRGRQDSMFSGLPRNSRAAPSLKGAAWRRRPCASSDTERMSRSRVSSMSVARAGSSRATVEVRVAAQAARFEIDGEVELDMADAELRDVRERVIVDARPQRLGARGAASTEGWRRLQASAAKLQRARKGQVPVLRSRRPTRCPRPRARRAPSAGACGSRSDSISLERRLVDRQVRLAVPRGAFGNAVLHVRRTRPAPVECSPPFGDGRAECRAGRGATVDDEIPVHFLAALLQLFLDVRAERSSRRASSAPSSSRAGRPRARRRPAGRAGRPASRTRTARSPRAPSCRSAPC